MLSTATRVSIVPQIGRAPRGSRTGRRHSARPHARPKRRKNPLRARPLNRGLASALACKNEELIGDSEGNITAASQRLQTEACLRPQSGKRYNGRDKQRCECCRKGERKCQRGNGCPAQ